MSTYTTHFLTHGHLHDESRCGSDGDMVTIVSTVPSDMVDSCVSLPNVALLWLPDRKEQPTNATHTTT
jgi:hypothetical protein